MLAQRSSLSRSGTQRITAIAFISILATFAAAGCASATSDEESDEPSDPGRSEPTSTHTAIGPASDLAKLLGRWKLEALTGVPPSELPPGSVPDNRHDLVVAEAKTFRWGAWSGHVSGSGNEFLLVVELPRKLGRRFAEYNAGVRILLEDGRLLVWLPDLGVDRDVDLGDAVDDIDAPDIAFRRANP